MYVCMYGWMDGRPSRLRILLSVLQEQWKTDALKQTLPRMKPIICRGDQGTTCSSESLRSYRIVAS